MSANINMDSGNERLLKEKTITILAMAVVTFLGGVLPLKAFSKLRHNSHQGSRRRWEVFISLCSCFSGGVFIAACFLDLIPETEELFDEILQQVETQYGITVDFAITKFVVCCGFFLILFIEQVVLFIKESLAAQDEREPLLGSDGFHHQHHHHLHQDEQLPVVEIHHPHNDPSHNHSEADSFKFHHSSLRSIMLLLALSFHSVFEGIAIGLQDNSGQFASIVIAVIVHKVVMAFSLGLNIAQSDLNKRNFLLSTVIFSLASPVGVIIGILMMGLPPSLMRDVCNGFLQGIAGGTFVYITFFDVLPPALNAPGNRILKVLFVIIGFACICGLLLVAHV